MKNSVDYVNYFLLYFLNYLNNTIKMNKLVLAIVMVYELADLHTCPPSTLELLMIFEEKRNYFHLEHPRSAISAQQLPSWSGHRAAVAINLVFLTTQFFRQ